MSRVFAYVLIWLALTEELEGFVFAKLWSTPLTSLGEVIFKGIPYVGIPPWHLAVILTLIMASRGAPGRVKEVLRSIRISFISIAALWVWGVVLKGGSAYQTIFQLHAFAMGLFVALLVAVTCRTRAHVVALGRVVLFAALYRCFILFTFYMLIARHLPTELPALTDHCDSVLFVGGLALTIVNVVERKSIMAILWFLFTAVVTITAVVLNGRRIAWLDIFVVALVIYLMTPKSKAKRRLNVVLIGLSPFMALYVAAGWGHPTGIFKPVGSISTMFGEHQDISSIMRDIENYNLMRTLKTNPFLGVGWGHEYIEEVRAFDISGGFSQYRYLPHNSLLGALAFTGMFGFAGLWQIVPVATFLHARVMKMSKEPVYRMAALWSIVTFIISMLQMWGDVGFNHIMVNTIVGVGIGLSARTPILAGVWGSTPASKPG